MIDTQRSVGLRVAGVHVGDAPCASPGRYRTAGGLHDGDWKHTDGRGLVTIRGTTA
jgi:hypothetical protein